ncbi:hypothetical protein D9756_010640 [Leucocoprinus leucothites]|uniref:Uncharacterized protein n=1 Tax=Leucocoprinus leucothites TaxID=201217 RepID=A0A8H5CTA1_9AGAR|nr:hypothetical protein D9756_010640 [Leucoagaricus leucothites]
MTRNMGSQDTKAPSEVSLPRPVEFNSCWDGNWGTLEDVECMSGLERQAIPTLADGSHFTSYRRLPSRTERESIAPGIIVKDPCVTKDLCLALQATLAKGKFGNFEVVKTTQQRYHLNTNP